MEDELTIIFAASIIMLIIIGLSVNGIVGKVLDYKKSQANLGRGDNSGATKAIAERTDMIEDRLAVLERIATDRGQLLSDEIEQLRVSGDARSQDTEKLS